ncbi:hypothetical protein F3Y22_tig00111084pilonHSYRG00063 [Hibiscus syriacus]|uniref:Uncharacterized protein n=1 Tax=Hibiscus syriacus TaxID=106335 RepID=A0A6A2Z344_HIBSY|nr:hypothetical protein F3Y22_tig00111084pilonHSYRG00063 [Hibiscus syriacus]
MERSNILQLYEIEYSDLMLLSSSSLSCSHYQEKMIMENLGPFGPGLLAVTNVPHASLLRRKLLPLASKLALLSREDRQRILRDYNLGSDVPLKNPDRNVSSFAMQLKYDQGLESIERKPSHKNENMDRIGDFEDDGFDNLEHMFKALGFCMMEIGLCLARICDRHIGRNELEESHVKFMPTYGNSGIMTGIFTLLTDPMFLTSHRAAENSEVSVSSDQECASPSGHSYLQVFHPNKNKVLMVKSSPESFIVQVGESADILSKGKLQSTLHCVRRPARLANLSRETFVEFLQPPWGKTFSISDYPMEHYNPSVQPLEQAEENTFSDQGQNALTLEIQKIVPPLSARLKDGMIFAEFSRETTKQYYGGSGLQSNK